MIVNTNNYKSDKNYVKVANGDLYYGNYSFDTDTSALFNKAASLGYNTPNYQQQISIDTLILGLKSQGVWSKLDFLYIYAYNDINLGNFSLINWKNPNTGLSNSSGTISYNAEGWMGNGSTGFINTNFNPTTSSGNYTANSAMIGVVEYATGNTTAVISQGDGTNSRSLITPASSTVQRINNTAALTASLDMSGIGYKYLDRQSTIAGKGINKSITTNITYPAAGALFSGNFLIGRNMSTGFSNRGISAAFAGAPLTTTEGQDFRNLINTFLTKMNLTQFA